MLAAITLAQAVASDPSTDIGGLVSSLLADLQSKAWIAAIPVALMLVYAVLKKFGVLGAPAALPAVPVAAPVDTSKAQALVDAPK